MWVENKAATFHCFQPLKKRILKTFDEGGRPRLTLIFVNLKFILLGEHKVKYFLTLQ